VPISIGVDAHNLQHDRRGIGRYARALLHRWMSGDVGRARITLLVANLFPGLAARRLAAECGVACVDVRRRTDAPRLGFEVAWHPWNGIFFPSGTRDVVTIHDVWPFADPASVSPQLDRTRKHPFVQAAAHAVHCITDSNFSKSEIVRHLGIEPSRISVVPLGVDGALLRAKPEPARIGGAERYLLFVGETEERKDLATLLRAAAKLPTELRTSTAIVVAGRRGSLDRPPDGVRVEFTGEIDDARLATLYAGAAAFVFPSLYEGFGLPVLEAMALGTPVVASDAASIPEAGGGAACYFKARDADACAAAIERVLTDAAFAQRLRESGRERAALMSWDRCADATLEILSGVR